MYLNSSSLPYPYYFDKESTWTFNGIGKVLFCKDLYMVSICCLTSVVFRADMISIIQMSQ